jgi:O-antigen ligase
MTWAILGALLLVPLTYGNALGNAAMLVSLAAPLFLRDAAAYRTALGLPSVRLLLGAFACLAISVIAMSRSVNDALIVFDFAPFLLTVPVAALCLRARIPDAASRIAFLALGGAMIGLVVAAYQYFVERQPRPGGWELSPIHFGDLAVILGFLSLAALGKSGSRWRRICWAGPPVGVAAAVLSGTRGALVVAVVLAPVAVWHLWIVYRPRPIAVAGVAAAIFGLFLLLGGGALAFGIGRALDATGIVFDLLSGRRVVDLTAGVRLDQYQAAVRAFFDSPIFGHGWRHEIESALQYMSPATREAYRLGHWGYIHNDFLSFSVGMGVFGSVAWVLLFAYPVVAILEKPAYPGPSARIFLTLVVWLGILVSGLSDVLFKTELTRSFYCFIPTAIMILCREDDRQPGAGDPMINGAGDGGSG